MARAARAGCRFAFSPVHPGGGFVPACHALGMLAVPAAFSPQEVYACLAAGALAVKLFPASLWRPEALRAMLAVGTFGDARIIPSGGVAPADFGASSRPRLVHLLRSCCSKGSWGAAAIVAAVLRGWGASVLCVESA